MADITRYSVSSLGSARNSSDAIGIYGAAASASADVARSDAPPTDGKNIPIVLGAVKLTGDVIWIRTFLNSKNECRAHVAVCFGRNMFGRPLGLMSVTQSGNYIYRRTGGDVIDPPSAVRFYDGTQTTADPKIVSYEGASRTPAFKGHIYAVLENVKLGDFGAEFTDNGFEEPVETGGNGGSNTFTCNSDLEGIELVYDFHRGMYYGIQFPLTPESFLVRSKDGCTIFDRTMLTKDGLSSYISHPDLVYYHYNNVFPIRCADHVVVPSIHVNYVYTVPANERYRNYVGPRNWMYSGTAPWEQVAFLEEPFLARAVYWDRQDILDPVFVPPPETPTDYIESYKIPGFSNAFAILRLFDRGDVSDDDINTAANFGLELPMPGIGNIACSIVDTVGAFETFGSNPRLFGLYFQPSNGSTIGSSEGKLLWGEKWPPYPAEYWTVTGAPEVTDIIYGRTEDQIVRLGGIKVNENQTAVTVYRIEHAITGMTYPYTINIFLPSGLEYSGFQYNSRNNNILVSASASQPQTFVSSRIYKISLDGEVSYSIVPTGLRIVSRKVSQENNGIVVLGNADNSLLYTYDSETEELKEIYNGDAPSGTPVVDLGRNKVSIPTVTGYTTYAISQLSPGDIPLTQILSDCCAIKGYSEDDIVFENLSSYSLKGLLISSTIRLSDLFNRLGSLYGFTFVETDRKLKFLKKRTPEGSYVIDAELSNNDLVTSGGDDAVIRTIARAGSNNLLGGMDLEFINPDKNYENDTLKIRRPSATFDTGASRRIETLSVPITLSPNDAYALMYESFYTLLQREVRAAFTLTSWASQVEPGDCLSVTVDGVSITGIAVRVSTRGDFAQDIEVESYLQSGETTVATIAPPDTTQSDSELIFGEYIHLDTPILFEGDFTSVGSVVQYHGLTAENTQAWGGADLYRSRDGTTYVKIAEYDWEPMAVARATVAIAEPALQFAMDEASVLTVELSGGDPTKFSTVSYLQQMNGETYAAYGRPGKWEIISFQTVTENSDGSISLTNLQRGLFGTHFMYGDHTLVGTEYFIFFSQLSEGYTHQVGDTVCILSPINLVKSVLPISDIGMNDVYGIVTPSVGLDAAIKADGIISGRSNKAMPVANLIAKHIPGQGTLEVTWDEVSPIPGPWSSSGTGPPMPEPVIYYVYFHMYSVSDFVVQTTETSYTWADYGTVLGLYANAEDEIFVEIFQSTATSPYTGNLFTIPPSMRVGACYAREG